MPDPAWTMQYLFNRTPEQNGFTRTITDSPVLNLVTGGAPDGRRVEVESTNGSVVFLTSDQPSLSESLGATSEAVLSTTGPGNAGLELTFGTRVLGVCVYLDRIRLTMANDDPNGNQVDVVVPTAPNSSDTTIRITFSPDQTVRIYRNGVLIGGPYAAPHYLSSFQRFLWWAEEGGTQVFRAMRLYVGGAVAPG